MVTLLGPLPYQILRLSFSPDGKYLAATSQNEAGLKVWRTSDWSNILTDDDYGDDTYGLSFDAHGGVYTASYDGFIRHYNSEFKLDAKYSAKAGAKPFSVAVNPETKALAAGFQDLDALAIFEQADSENPVLAHELHAGQGTLRAAVWSAGGQTLLGAGQYAQNGKYMVRTWNRGAWDTARDNDVSGGDEVMDLIPCGKDIAFATESGTFGTFNTSGKLTRFQDRGAIDMRQVKGKSFTASRDGLRVWFPTGGKGEKPVVFDLSQESVEPSAANPPGFIEADTSSLAIENWNGAQNPALAGKPLELEEPERALSAAVSPDKAALFLGSDFFLRKFDASANKLVELSIPGSISPWGLNAAKDGRLLVVASEDGTIRWYRQDNLKEVAALFVQPQDRRWIIWTPQGYYLASRGGEEIIGWQVNRGWNKGADFFPAVKFRTKFYRPDIVRLAFQLADAGKAIEEANPNAGPIGPRDIRGALPPVLNIVDPITGTHFSQKNVRFTFEVRSPLGEPLTGVKALIDGESLSGSKGFVPIANQSWAPEKTVRGSLDLELPARDVTVTLIATSGKGSSEKQSVRLRWGAAEEPAPASLPVLKAVIAGINIYKAAVAPA